MKKRKIVPSFLTSMNLLCGFWAILINDPVKSFYLVLIGIAFDFVDGFSARALKVPSLFGKELDSLADMVTFGVVPGFLFYQHLLKNPDDSEFMFYFKMFLATLIPVLAGLRLAKFNVKDSGKIGFAGLPSSAAALFTISLPFLYKKSAFYFDFIENNTVIVILTVVIITLLMVTNLPMFNLKGLKDGLKGNAVQLFYGALCIVLAITFGWASLPVLVVSYIIISLITVKIWRR